MSVWAAELGLQMVPVLYRSTWDKKIVQAPAPAKSEGYVVRLAGCFRFEDFGRSVAKFVRAGHVTTGEHWMSRVVVPNGLRAP